MNANARFQRKRPPPPTGGGRGLFQRNRPVVTQAPPPAHTRPVVTQAPLPAHTPPPHTKMDSHIRTAESLGRLCFFDMDLFAEECDHCSERELASLLKDVGIRLHTLLENWSSNDDSYRHYVLSNILPDITHRSFYFKQPIDNFFLKIHGFEQLEAAANVYPFLIQLLDHGASAERMACSLFPTLATLTLITPYIDELCMFLHRLGRDKKAQEMLASHCLIQNLSRRFSKRRAKDIIGMIIQSKMYTDILLVYPIIKSCVELLYYEASNVHRIIGDDNYDYIKVALDMLIHATSVTQTKVLLIPDVIYLSRHGWMTQYGEFICNMLSGKSIQFIMELEKTGQLVSLIRKSFSVAPEEHGAVPWISIREMLRMQWPSRVALVMNEASFEEPSVTTTTCPITLQPIVHPVVASDGHTYEREALMQHLIQNGMVSPLTKQVLDYNLFPNYCCNN
jgi:hypothetical protein